MVTQELEAHDNMQRLAADEVLPRYKTNEIVSAMLLKHSLFLARTETEETDPHTESARSIKVYKKELNFKV